MENNNIAIISGPFLSAHAVLNRVVPALLTKNLNVHIFMVPMPKRKTAVGQSVERFRFYEYDLLANYVYPYLNTQPEVPNKLTTIDRLLSMRGVHHYNIDDVNSPEMREALDTLPLLGTLSLHNPQVLTKDSIDFFKQKGFLWNLHRGLLPDYRGLYIPFWAALNGEAHHGITLHDLVFGIDEGDVIQSHRTPLDHKGNVFKHVLDLVEPGARMVLDAVDQCVSKGCVTMCPQDLKKGIYRTVPTETEVAAARKLGVRFLPSPIEILKLYQDFFGSNENLRNVIIEAIVEFERAHVTERVDQRQNSAA